MEGLDPKGGNLSESRFLYAGSGSAMKLMGPRTMRGTVLKRADLDMEGLDPGGGDLSKYISLYTGSGSEIKLMGPRTLARRRSQELTWISKGSIPRAATFLSLDPYMRNPDLQ